MLFTNVKRGCFAKDPAVVRFGGSYYLYYSIKYGDEPFKIGIGIARSHDMETWEDIDELPLTAEYEKNGVGAPAAIVLRGQVHLFYQTYGNWAKDAICHAVSDDGVHFEKDDSNPIFRPTADWCCGRAIDADVCVFNDRLYLYFATRDHDMAIQKVGCAWAPLNSGFSRSTWTQAIAQSILSPELKWEGQCIEAPATVVNGARIFMFYGGSYNCKPQQIGCAVSDDGVFFRRIFMEPFMANGEPGSWNSCESGHPYAFRDDDSRVYLFYQGSADMGKTWYLSKVEIGFDESNLPYIRR
ncbi:MAG: family 43 glycosylhydrolase [Clostridia bacterium]|nr:family 43 glycosylhydrolase [Clostridia bacterium]